MPQIPQYEERIQAQGGINTRANPDDFGAQIGQGIQRFGAGIADVGDTMMRIEEANQTTDAQVQIAKEREAQTKELFARRDAADPNNPEILASFEKDMQASLEKKASRFTTPQASKAYRVGAANLGVEMTQRGLSIQAELFAQAASNQIHDLKKSLAGVVVNDPTQIGSVLAQAEQAINAPGSTFDHLPAPTRAKALQDLQNSIAMAAATKITRVDPEATLKSFSPESLAQFKPFEGMLKANTAPGGQVNLKPETQAVMPEIAAASARVAVVPNIVAALVEAPAKPFEGMLKENAPAQVAGSVSKLLDNYGGDYGKAVAAFYFGKENLDSTLRAFGGSWQENLPATVQQSVNTAMENAGMVPSQQEPMPEPPPTAGQQAPVPSSLPWMKHLTWEQQDHLVKEGIQLQHQRISMAHTAQQMAEHEERKVREAARGEYINKIISPKEFGQFRDIDVVNDPRLNGEDRQHLAEYFRARTRELRSDSENRSNPTEVRRLMLAIHAADNDPTKTYNLAPVDEAYRLGRISTPEYKMLRTETEQMRDGVSNPFQKQVHQAREAVYTSLTRSMFGQLQPDQAADAAYRFNVDMEHQIAELRKANKDPRTLLDPMSRDYLLKPERIQSFMGRKSFSEFTQQAAEKQKAVEPTTTQNTLVKDGKTYYLATDGKYYLTPQKK